MRDNKILAGVFSTILAVTCLLSHEAAFGANNLLKQSSVQKSAVQKTAFLASEKKSKRVLKQYANAHSLTDRQLVELLKAVGFKGKGLRTAWAVAKAESNGRPFAFNGNLKTGDNSYGIFQINMLGNLGPDRRDKFDLDFNAELFNPVKNAQIVYRMTEQGTNWKSWKYAKTPAVKKWLKKFPKPYTISA